MANFSTSNSGTQFHFNEEHPGLGGICVRLLAPDEAKRIERECTKLDKTVVGGQVVESKKVNDKLESELIYNYCIVDWTNVLLDGNPISCTIQNKIVMMRCLDFARFVGDCIRKLAIQNKAIDEAQLKNSESTSDGLTQNQTV